MIDDPPKNVSLNMQAMAQKAAIRVPSFGADAPKPKPVPKQPSQEPELGMGRRPGKTPQEILSQVSAKNNL